MLKENSERTTRYGHPRVENMIVGFSGIDPQISDEEIALHVREYLSSLRVSVDSGEIL